MADCPEGYHSKTGTLLVGDPRVRVPVIMNASSTNLPPMSGDYLPEDFNFCLFYSFDFV